MSLYIVATPIGNLSDISKRTLDTLQSVDLIIAEDTRHTRKLLSHYDIHKPLQSFHGDSNQNKIDAIVKDLAAGKQIALVTDAGTPLIADPGSNLITKLRDTYHEIKIIPIPGPSAITAALSVSGFSADTFIFWGYPPQKPQKRLSFFKRIVDTEYTQVFFSTPHHIIRDITLLKEAGVATRQLFAAREMTKQFESHYYGVIEEVLSKIKHDPQKGEYTIVVSKI